MLNMKKPINLLFTLLLSCLITACSFTHNTPITENQSQLKLQRQNQLKHITAFQITGSLSYFAEKSRYYGRFYLKQTSYNNYQLKLTTPIGTSIFSLNVTPSYAEYTDNKGKTYHDVNAEQLMKNITGMDMPLKTMTKWLIGYSNDLATDKFDNAGRLLNSKLLQANQTWDISFNKYNKVRFSGSNIDLPTIIELNNSNNKLRLTISNWKLN